MKRIVIRVTVIAVIAFFCCSWGYLVHRTINQLAIYQLPKPMRPFFYLNKDSVVLNAPRPDMRRSTDPTEFSKHVIDIEAYGDSAEVIMPFNWSQAVKTYGE